jgi:hypothetical protein
MKKLLTLLIILLACAQLTDAQPRGRGPRVAPSILNPYKGYVNITELTYGIGLSDINVSYAKYHTGLTTVNGYQINRFWITGAGIGLLFYNDGYLVPLYLSGRFSYPAVNSRFSWYINTDAGALFYLKDFQGTRLFVNPLVGARYTITSTLAANIGIGLFTQMGPNTHRDSFLNFKLGVIFIPQR